MSIRCLLTIHRPHTVNKQQLPFLSFRRTFYTATTDPIVIDKLTIFKLAGGLKTRHAIFHITVAHYAVNNVANIAAAAFEASQAKVVLALVGPSGVLVTIPLGLTFQTLVRLALEFRIDWTLIFATLVLNAVAHFYLKHQNKFNETTYKD